MARWVTLCIAASWLLGASVAQAAVGRGAGENCAVCHRVSVQGKHANLPCRSCHGDDVDTLFKPASAENRAAGCVGCHRGYAALFDHAMATKSRERQFVERSFAKGDAGFYGKNCASCHLTGCGDCHGSGHSLARPRDRSCFVCHKGYFVGTDYYGMAPREESLRYQRGETAYGENFLKMAPDVHAEAGIPCGACHSMASLAAGRSAAKGCVDCHKVSRKVPEHRIAAHLERLECYACHSAWAPQEYGTFYLRFTDSPAQQSYELKENAGEYVKSVYLKKQDSPPLGVNSRGKVSPIRPQFIAYFTRIVRDRPVGGENRLLAAEWKAFFPHTVRRGSVMCEGCHDNPRRFLGEADQDRIYDLKKDGLSLPSFWQREGQRVVNGAFLPDERYRRLALKSPAYLRAYLEKWQTLVDHVENSSAR